MTSSSLLKAGRITPFDLVCGCKGITFFLPGKLFDAFFSKKVLMKAEGFGVAEWNCLDGNTLNRIRIFWRRTPFSAPERPSLMVAHFAAKVTSGWFSRVMRPFVKVVTFFRFGRYADLSASRCIKRSGVPALVFQGDRDADVPFELSACARVNGGNVRAEVCSGKAHNVYNTFAAEGLLKRLKDGILRMNEMNDGERAEFFSSQDYGAICEEDEAVMGEVLRFIKDC